MLTSPGITIRPLPSITSSATPSWPRPTKVNLPPSNATSASGIYTWDFALASHAMTISALRIRVVIVRSMYFRRTLQNLAQLGWREVLRVAEVENHLLAPRDQLDRRRQLLHRVQIGRAHV